MNSDTIRIGIVGIGKIVRDQHIPALEANKDFTIAASASRNAGIEGVPGFKSIEEMLADGPALDAVSLCMPPQARYQAAQVAIAAGKHVFLEKPPGATVSEVLDLIERAREAGVTLFASWHSRYAPAVEPARAFLEKTRIRSARLNWKEDVRRWHPNQAWIWQPGGFGVFDPFINCLSIATHILPAMHITTAELDFPENRDAPISARMAFEGADGFTAEAEIDWLQTGPQSWDIIVETDDGNVALTSGGARLTINGEAAADAPEREYPALYERFSTLVKSGQSDVDLAPLQHVADAFMLGRRNVVLPFHD
ncbi:gfo/Idh/MocA family oxidoreductase [Salmonella enterica subsp. enterica serovar Java]|nr:gfo/Idh/MocA family oxidoreductase [Salmonella enterica subsp. enterica serovar Java]